VFDCQKYALSRRMTFFLQENGYDVWKPIVERYKEPYTTPIDKHVNKISEKNSNATNSIMSGLASSVYVKVMHCDFSKDIWEKIQSVYKGDSKFKGAKIQTYKGQFKQLKMKENENFVAYFLQADEIVNIIKGLQE
jgi:hypothetical protein